MELKILSPTAILGYGFPLESLKRGLKEGVDVIAVDAGSTDPGPYYLGEGVSFVPREAVERDLYHLVRAAIDTGAPLLIGSAGGSGAKPHVDETLAILRRVVERIGVRLVVGIIYSDVDKGKLLSLLNERRHEPLEGYPYGPLSKEAIRTSTRIVAQIGVEPFIELLKKGVNVIVAGRSVDVAPFAALPWLKGFDKGLSIHLGKILECGAIAAEPGSGSDSMLGVLRSSEFEVRPLNPRRRATLASVAEHALYERTNPFREYVPGGYADMSKAIYEENEDAVIVRGTKWVELPVRMVKLEGARLAGHRVIVVAGARDPDFIARLDSLMEESLRNVETLLGTREHRVFFHVYGRNGVMGSREPIPQPSHEVGLVIEVIASNMEEAKAVAGLLRSTLLHIGWPGRRTTAGNLALPFSPSDIYAGRVYEWSIWHLIEERDPLEFSSIDIIEIRG